MEETTVGAPTSGTRTVELEVTNATGEGKAGKEGKEAKLDSRKTNAPAGPDFILWPGRIIPYERTFAAMQEKPAGLGSAPSQEYVYHFYQLDAIQLFVAACIVLNFVLSALSRQIGGSPTFDAFEVFFLIIFTVELIINMWGSWCNLFWQSSWNVFDFIVVAISILAEIVPSMPGISVLRLFRAFRVVRLFKRVETLRIIIEGIIAALPGVFAAFAVTSILMSIWAIMGVDFYAKHRSDDFGSYIKAMFTMWKIMTLEGWEDISDGLIFDNELPFASVYFISYTFLVGMVMTNVVVAILLERYLASTDGQREIKEQEKYDADEAAGIPHVVTNAIVTEAVIALRDKDYVKALHFARALNAVVPTEEEKDESNFILFAKSEHLIDGHPVSGKYGAVVTASGNEAPIDAKEKQSACGMTGAAFAATAKPLRTDLFGTSVLGEPQTFPVSGNRGWLVGTKIEVGAPSTCVRCGPVVTVDVCLQIPSDTGSVEYATVHLKVTVLGGKAWAK